MSIITFWSDLEKETGQTSTSIALATQMAIEHNYKILLLSTYYNETTQEEAFGDTSAINKGIISLLGGNKKVNIDSGIEGLIKVITSNKITPKLITNYTKIVFKERLEFLNTYKGKEGYEKLLEIYPELILNASQYYDLVLIDLNKGVSEFSQKILELSNIIIYSMNQKMKSIETYMECRNEGVLKGKNNILTFIGRYDRYSKYSMKNISRYIKQDINSATYNTLFSQACEEGKVAEFFLKMRTVKPTDRNAHFVGQINRLSEAILYKLQELQMKI